MKGHAFRRAVIENENNSVTPSEEDRPPRRTIFTVEGPAVVKEHGYFVYMIASRSRVLYIGMTNNLRHRVWEHKNDLIDGFTKTYKCHRLVFFQSFDEVANAIDREKQLKGWNRTKKDWLIAHANPTWEDLAAKWYKRHQFEPEKQVS